MTLALTLSTIINITLVVGLTTALIGAAVCAVRGKRTGRVESLAFALAYIVFMWVVLILFAFTSVDQLRIARTTLLIMLVSGAWKLSQDAGVKATLSRLVGNKLTWSQRVIFSLGALT